MGVKGENVGSDDVELDGGGRGFGLGGGVGGFRWGLIDVNVLCQDGCCRCLFEGGCGG